MGAFLRSGDPNAAPLPFWQPWTSADPAALVLDAGPEADSLSAVVRPAPADYDAVLDRLDADNSVPAPVKDRVIRTVLSGRFFSAALDRRYRTSAL